MPPVSLPEHLEWLFGEDPGLAEALHGLETSLGIDAEPDSLERAAAAVGLVAMAYVEAVAQVIYAADPRARQAVRDRLVAALNALGPPNNT